MRRALSVLLSILIGAAPALALADVELDHAREQRRVVVPITVRDYTSDALGNVPLEVAGACEILGVTCVFVPDGTSALQLAVIGEPIADLLGLAAAAGCSRFAFAVKDPQVIAHEVGHMLGLPHLPWPGNLMYPARDGGGFELLPWQRMIIADTAREFARRC